MNQVTIWNADNGRRYYIDNDPPMCVEDMADKTREVSRDELLQLIGELLRAYGDVLDCARDAQRQTLELLRGLRT